MISNKIKITKSTFIFNSCFKRCFNKTNKSPILLKNEPENFLPLFDKDLPNGFTFKSEFSIEETIYKLTSAFNKLNINFIFKPSNFQYS